MPSMKKKVLELEDRINDLTKALISHQNRLDDIVGKRLIEEGNIAKFERMDRIMYPDEGITVFACYKGMIGNAWRAGLKWWFQQAETFRVEVDPNHPFVWYKKIS